MSRRTRKRRPKPDPLAVALVVEDRPVNWARLRQTFGNMSHRGTRTFEGYVLVPVVVDARYPEEAVILTELAILEMTKKLPPT